MLVIGDQDVASSRMSDIALYLPRPGRFTLDFMALNGRWGVRADCWMESEAIVGSFGYIWV